MSARKQLQYTPNEKVCFTDGDVLVYQAAFASQRTTFSIRVSDGTVHRWGAKRDANAWCIANDIDVKLLVTEVIPDKVSACNHTIKKMLEGILKGSQCHRQVIFLTGEGNYREKIYPAYKANRKQEKPYHYAAARKYMIDVHGAIVINGMEADDALSISQLHNIRKRKEYMDANGGGGTSTQDSCIATIDKDLDMVRGWHYNWNNKDRYFVASAAGLHFFYKQLITGDATDNIKGIAGKGAKFAQQILPTDMDATTMYHIVLEQYVLAWVKHFISAAEATSTPAPDAEWIAAYAQKDLILNAQLLWMKTSYRDKWTPPQEREDEIV